MEVNPRFSASRGREDQISTSGAVASGWLRACNWSGLTGQQTPGLCFYLLSTGITSVCMEPTLLMWALGPNLVPLCFQGKYLHRELSPQSPVLQLKENPTEKQDVCCQVLSELGTSHKDLQELWPQERDTALFCLSCLAGVQ